MSNYSSASSAHSNSNGLFFSPLLVDCNHEFDCGWCASSKLCMAGNLTGPNEGGACAKWTRYVRNCPDEGCVAYGTCARCAQHPGCGWCPTTLQCMVIPTAHVELRQCTSFIAEPNDCPWPCDKQFTCYDCTMLMRGKCGWYNGRCVSAAENGPAVWVGYEAISPDHEGVSIPFAFLPEHCAGLETSDETGQQI
eukprot:CAMPEP_0184652966 /NCGR_PEP_ID=MMETSP0308-20130426/10676_1 /TAXON_ID=38269 /ORGANISM="Gloeochaete witrockiana, Strain SAG 46.84" /LENGTH=193 /DNA_ID=CAMNT_0027088153 /DNA_START=233 /DNA_END=815 /DNA_ORIENTATION=+